MSILIYHHIIPQQFRGHSAFRGIDERITGIDSVANGIYLPADYLLAKAMGISPHPGGHPEFYYKAVKCVLDQITKIPEPDIRAVKIKALMDTMRIGFNKGELYTNVPIGGTLEEVQQGVEKFVKKTRFISRKIRTRFKIFEIVSRWAWRPDTSICWRGLQY